MSELKKAIFHGVQNEEIAALLGELISIPSRNPPGEEKACAECIAHNASKWGLEVELVPDPFPDRPQVVVSIEGSEDHPTLVLNGHIDTVPEGDLGEWSFDPFGGIIHDEKMYGRGACDMKGGLTAALIAAKALQASKVPLKGNLVVQCAVGEETGDPGTKTLLERGFTGDWGVVLEPTGLKVAIVERGVAWFHLTTKGRAAHAGTPHRGTNAIAKANAVISALEDYNAQIAKRRHELVPNPSCTVTMIRGGSKENVVPASCTIAIDRRFLPGTSIERVENELRTTLSRLSDKDPQLRYELKRIGEFEAASISRNSTIVRVMEKNLREIGVAPTIWGTPYSSDVRNFVNDAKVPAVTFGPGDISVAHGANEFIELDEVALSAKALIGLAVDLLT